MNERTASGEETFADEDALTRRFAELAGAPTGALVAGIGDDCAVLRIPPEDDLLWSVDSQEEGIHFRRDWFRPEEIGFRAVAVALSDLAASAGYPLALLVSIGSGHPDPGDQLLGVYEGALAAGRRWGAVVAGGDLSRRIAGLAVTVSVLGAAPRGRALLRSGARMGDELWVTGVPGLSRSGLRALVELGRGEAERVHARAVERFVRPAPRLAEARWLRDHVSPHAALDLSDGLGRDLHRLCAASGVGARLEVLALTALTRKGTTPAGAGAEEGSREARIPDEAQILDDALYGGEDYELLLACAPGSASRRSTEFADLFGVPLTRVGEVTEERTVLLSSPSGTVPLRRGGWDHVAVERR